MKALFRNFMVTLSGFKLASLLNILGLNVAFAAFIIIMIQVRYEYTFDTAYKKSGRIYRIESTIIPTEATVTSRESHTALCARPFIEMMLPSIPQIESYAIMHNAPSEMYIKYQTGEGERTGMMIPFRKVSEGITEVFDLEIIEGSSASFAEPGKALISLSLALQMFAKESAINKQITQSDGTFYTISGVYKDFAENTSIVNDVKLSMADQYKTDWMEWALTFFVVLTQDASPEEVVTLLSDHFDKTGMGALMGFTEPVSFRLSPIEEIYYQQDTSLDIAPKGNRTTTMILLSIALLVVSIAAVNFLNFSTAITPARIKSINIQKVLGESIVTLRLALILEAIGICLISYLLALCWVYLLNMAGLSSFLLTSISLKGNEVIVLNTLFLALAVGALAGVYPAFYMTSFRPALILKGAFGMSAYGRKLRVVLTGFQFFISTGLIIAALFIWLQNRYMIKTSELNNDKQIAMVSLDKEIIIKHADVLMEKLKSNHLISDVAFSDWPIGFLDYYPYTYTKTVDDEDIMYHYLPVSFNFIHLMELKLKEGRDFEKVDVMAAEEKLIINEVAARQFKVKTGDRLENGAVIIGIIDNFHFMTLRKKIEPMALTIRPLQSDIFQPTLYIRTAGNALGAVEQIKAGIAEVDPLYPVDVTFYDKEFEKAYQTERKASAQITILGLMAVIISLMGVFGLVTFQTQYRRKEISIRKVMGATVYEILQIFNKKFIGIVVVSFMLAIPVVWYGVEQWLQSFAYRIALYWWVFVLSLLIILLITIIIISIQSWRIATSNPIHSLRSE